MTDKSTITCTGRCNGMGDPDDTGSYVRLIHRERPYGYGHGCDHYFKLSEDAAETLIAELQGALKQKRSYDQSPTDPRHGGKIAMPSRDLIARALAFYEGSPDGQYDDDVVVPILRAALESS